MSRVTSAAAAADGMYEIMFITIGIVDRSTSCTQNCQSLTSFGSVCHQELHSP